MYTTAAAKSCFLRLRRAFSAQAALSVSIRSNITSSTRPQMTFCTWIQNSRRHCHLPSFNDRPMLAAEILRVISGHLQNKRVDTFECISTVPGSTTEKLFKLNNPLAFIVLVSLGTERLHPHPYPRDALHGRCLFVVWLCWCHRAQNDYTLVPALEMLFKFDASWSFGARVSSGAERYSSHPCPGDITGISSSLKSCCANLIICRKRFRSACH